MATYRVSTQSQLNSALNSVEDGDTILLASGTYNSLDMRTSRRSDYDFDRKVTIASESASRPATINKMELNGVSNVEFRDVVFEYERGKSSTKPFFIQNSSEITFDDVEFAGYIKNGYGSGLGLRVKDSSDVTVSDSHFHGFGNGISFSSSEDITLTGNLIENMSNDGFTFGGITGMLIEDNTFQDYKSPNPKSQHKDNIQFRVGPNEDPSENVTIRGNTIDSSEVRHGIYIGNESYKEGDLYAMHRNILIEDNYIRSAHLHGITVLHGDGITVRDNTVVQNTERGYKENVNVPLINVSIFSHDVEITGNQVASVQEEQDSSWDIHGNFVGSKRYLHWAGDYGFKKGPDLSKLSATAAFATVAVVETDESGTAASKAVAMRFEGTQADGDTVIEIDGADFSRGDSFVFANWKSGVFRDNDSGNAVDDWNDRGSVRVDSALDLQELAHFSPAISAETSGDDLTFAIDQGKAGVAEFHFAGLADAFLAADRPELF